MLTSHIQIGIQREHECKMTELQTQEKELKQRTVELGEYKTMNNQKKQGLSMTLPRIAHNAQYHVTEKKVTTKRRAPISHGLKREQRLSIESDDAFDDSIWTHGASRRRFSAVMVKALSMPSILNESTLEEEEEEAMGSVSPGMITLPPLTDSRRSKYEQ